MVRKSDLIPEKDDREVELRTLVSDIDALCEQIAEKRMVRNDLDFELRQVKVLFFGQLGELYIEKAARELEYRKLRRKVELILEEALTDDQIEERLGRQFREEQEELDHLTGEQDHLFEERTAVERLADVDPDLKKGLRRLYLDLAKKFHPDRFSGSESREKAGEVMKRLNEHYGNNDLYGMLELQKGVGIEMFADLQETLQNRIGRARLLRSRLRQSLAELDAEIEGLRSGQLYQIKLQIDAGRENGRDVMKDLAAQLRKDLEEINARCASLRERLGGLGQR
ncbi:MAG: hypothetical protein HOC74_34070 [Gemmatimonadetes bacterium]|jgi:hypothetical protein|nr:hypothetical protein [Gemmatimonadota bacterium]